MPCVLAMELAKKNTLLWACDMCLKSGRALVANPAHQTFCDHTPFLAYFDQNKRCTDFAKRFAFSAEEQRHWYEQLKFWVQSEPRQCALCRRSRRLRKRVNCGCKKRWPHSMSTIQRAWRVPQWRFAKPAIVARPLIVHAARAAETNTCAAVFWDSGKLETISRSVSRVLRGVSNIVGDFSRRRVGYSVPGGILSADDSANRPDKPAQRRF